jgi:tRNA (cmo5U34)-methyltransferase
MYDSSRRFLTMAQAYDAMAPHMVPQYDFLQREALAIPGFGADARIAVADLGAGSGRFLEKLLASHPNAMCYWVDYSGDFLAVAKERLAAYGRRVEFLLMRLEDRWEDAIPEKLDAVFSMPAIHHLESAEKKALYGRCYEKLKPSGWLVNADEMRTVHADAYMKNMAFWWEHYLKTREGAKELDARLVAQWGEHFERWKQRNIDGFGQVKTKGDDLHEEFLTQMDWLAKIGFTHVDVYVKYRLWCVIGGQKPG